DEDVVLHALREQLRRHLDDARHEARRVDDRVPRTAAQRLELAVAIALQLLDVRKQIRMRLAAVEQRQRVAARACRVDDVRPDEVRATEDEDRLLRRRRDRWSGRAGSGGRRWLLARTARDRERARDGTGEERATIDHRGSFFLRENPMPRTVASVSQIAT